MTTYSGNATNNPTSITIPDDGDDIDAISVNVPFEGLMDKVVHILHGNPTYEGSTWTFGDATLVKFNDQAGVDVVTPGELWLTSAGVAPTFTRGVTAQSVDNTGALGWPITNTLAIGRTYYYPINELPDAATITSLSIVHNPDNATAPTAKVKVSIYQMPLDGSASSDAFTPIEDPAAGAGYTAAHTFTATPGSPVVVNLNTHSYWFKVVAETGGSAVPGVISAPPSLTYKANIIDLGK